MKAFVADHVRAGEKMNGSKSANAQKPGQAYDLWESAISYFRQTVLQVGTRLIDHPGNLFRRGKHRNPARHGMHEDSDKPSNLISFKAARIGR